ncbi:MAG TPA: rhodanese-like domain-containing protein [Chryseolinea sp.]|nr:rhodanese-like domain-containing protein [Chryseolinea sp.]
MKLLLLPLLFISVTAIAQLTEYLCPPCNNACDKVIHDKPGICPDCHMKLVLKTALQFKNLSAAEFCERINANPTVVLLDVRSVGEFKDTDWGNTYGHFKNAININIDELEKRLGELEKYKDREILVYCSHSVRSPRAVMMMNEHGFKNVSNLAGGVSTLRPKSDECLKNYFVVH